MSIGNKLKSLSAIALLLIIGFVAGCEKEGPAERLGERVDEATDKATEAVEEAAYDTKRKIKDATD